MLKMTVESTCTNANGELEQRHYAVEFPSIQMQGSGIRVISDYEWSEYLLAFRQLMDATGFAWLPSTERIVNAVQDLIDEDIERDEEADGQC